MTGAVVDTLTTRYWSNGFVYAVVKGPQIDSIINVPYATRTDSLLKYLVKPDKAKFDFEFVDGKNRVDLKFGDKLKVTSENGIIVKEYFVAVSEYVKANNALLRTVTWPDIDKTLYPRWIVGDTLPEFTSLKTEYIVELRNDANKIPAFQFKTQDLKARIEVKNAADIDGTMAQRTTSVTVYAESDTTSLTYNFQFVKQGVPVQPNIAEPFISELIKNVNTQGFAVEIYNPGTEDLDLSRYMYVRGNAGQTWQEAVGTLVDVTAAAFSTTSDGLKIYKTHYVPSKRWAADGSLAEWAAIPNKENPFVGRGFLKDDNQTDPWVKGQDVWVMGVGTSTAAAQVKIRQESDFVFKGNTADNTLNAWPSTMLNHRETPPWTNNYTYLLQILNDSILNGTKDVRDARAYELIDRFDARGDSLAGKKLTGWMSLIRKPSVSKGNVDRMGGGKETAESSEWIYRTNTPGVNLVDNIGLHIMTPLTNFKSTVTSMKFIVTPGYRGDNLSITGSITAYTPKTIALVLDKADSSQVFVFKRGTSVLTDDQILADADVLSVTSGDGRSTTVYKLINSPLDSNTKLTAKSGSGLIVIGNKVTGATVGMTLKDAVANLVVANKSILNVFDASTGALQPLRIHNRDSLVNNVMVNDNIYLQVVAENSDKAIYNFDFGFASSKAVLISSTIKIDQDKKMILELPAGSTATSLLSMISANNGSTVKILDKAGFERTTGYMNIDDVIEVIAPDGVGKTVYGFAGEGFTVSNKQSIESQNTVVIFPNPVTHVLYIKGFELASVQVYTLSGTMMISKTASYSNSVDVNSLPKGIYIIKMTDVNGKVVVDKFLKK